MDDLRSGLRVAGEAARVAGRIATTAGNQAIGDALVEAGTATLAVDLILQNVKELSDALDKLSQETDQSSQAFQALQVWILFTEELAASSLFQTSLSHSLGVDRVAYIGKDITSMVRHLTDTSMPLDDRILKISEGIPKMFEVMNDVPVALVNSLDKAQQEVINVLDSSLHRVGHYDNLRGTPDQELSPTDTASVNLELDEIPSRS